MAKTATEPVVHLFLNCPAIKPGDEITEYMVTHQHSKAAPDEATCTACRQRCYNRGRYY